MSSTPPSTAPTIRTSPLWVTAGSWAGAAERPTTIVAQPLRHRITSRATTGAGHGRDGRRPPASPETAACTPPRGLQADVAGGAALEEPRPERPHHLEPGQCGVREDRRIRAVPEQELHGLVDVAGAELDLQGVVEGARVPPVGVPAGQADRGAGRRRVVDGQAALAPGGHRVRQGPRRGRPARGQRPVRSSTGRPRPGRPSSTAGPAPWPPRSRPAPGTPGG